MKKFLFLVSAIFVAGMVYAAATVWNTTSIPEKNITDKITHSEFNSLTQTVQGIFHNDKGTAGNYADDLFGFGVNNPTMTADAAGAVKISGQSLTCGSATEGVVRYNTYFNHLELCDGSNWRGLRLWSDCTPESCTKTLGTCTNTGTKSCVEGELGDCSAVTPTETSWTPATSTKCAGTSFFQTSNCGTTRSATGTMCCPVCSSYRPCGDDGCGGSCGPCAGTCSAAGSCVFPVPKDKLVAYYPMNGSVSDVSGNSRTATITATKTTDRLGRSNYAYDFNGTSTNKMQTPITETTLSANSGRDFSVSLWLRPEGWGTCTDANHCSYGKTILSNRYVSGNSAYGFMFGLIGEGGVSSNSPSSYLGMQRGQLSVSVGGGCILDQVISTTALPLNSWAHIVMSFDYNDSNGNITVSFYRNGSKLSTKAFYQTACNTTGSLVTSDQITHSDRIGSPRNLMVGYDTDTSADYYVFDGKLDEVAIYDRALTASEAKEIYDYQVQYSDF